METPSLKELMMEFLLELLKDSREKRKIAEAEVKDEREMRKIAEEEVRDAWEKGKRLEAEIAALNQLLEVYSKRTMDGMQERRLKALQKIREEYYIHHPHERGRVVCDSDMDANESGNFDIIDTLIQPTTEIDTSNDNLLCPRCRSTYSFEDHCQFLTHVGQCGMESKDV